ncbi:MAG TPA: hypothetical protein VJS12_22355 [Steroidobacteraceae bacterium]|nr:hypothetical protein [Steroidobacteraceae bacterium]
MHARILVLLTLLTCASTATTPLAAQPTPAPTRIPGTPEEAMLGVYQRLTALEQQVKSLQQQVAAEKATNVEQAARIKAIIGEVMDLVGRVGSLESTRSEMSPPTQSSESRQEVPPPAPTSVVNRIVAPFEVVTKTGKPLLLVTEDSSSSKARITIGINADANTGQITLRDKTGRRLVAMAELTIGGGFVTLGQGGDVLSLIGVDEDGQGGILLRNDKGTRVFEAGRGGARIYNTDEKIIAGLSVGPQGGGVLELMDPAGEKRVEAGTTTEGLGIVRAGPAFKCGPSPQVMGLGLADCIMGHEE